MFAIHIIEKNMNPYLPIRKERNNIKENGQELHKRIFGAEQANEKVFGSF